MEGFKNKNAPFIINDKIQEDRVRNDAKHFSGWIEKNEGDWASTRLEYIKKISPGTWEWRTKAAFTD